MKINRFYIYVVGLLAMAVFFESVIDDKIRVGILMIIQLLMIIIKELITIADKKPIVINFPGENNKIELHTKDKEESC